MFCLLVFSKQIYPSNHYASITAKAATTTTTTTVTTNTKTNETSAMVTEQH
jgi:hypothetical protein